jgi:hypothetical protein
MAMYPGIDLDQIWVNEDSQEGTQMIAFGFGAPFPAKIHSFTWPGIHFRARAGRI